MAGILGWTILTEDLARRGRRLPAILCNDVSGGAVEEAELRAVALSDVFLRW